MKLLPYQRIRIETTLTLEEAVARLQRAIPDAEERNRSYDMFLSGDVAKRGFCLTSETSGCNPINWFWKPLRPEAHGRFTESPNGVTIEITVIVPRLIIIFLIGFSLFYLIFCKICDPEHLLITSWLTAFQWIDVYITSIIVYNLDADGTIARIRGVLTEDQR